MGKQIAASVMLVLVLASPSYAGRPKLGFEVSVEGGGFFLNPVVTKLLVTDVEKASLAEVAGMKAGDIILKIQGQDVAGRRASELRAWMDFNPGETRSLRVRHPDGTEFDARFTYPKG
jgi:C-terminal processing protease CtpA/Prc